MSYTSLYALYKTRANRIEELHNGHGSGPAIWNYISIKLYGEKLNMFNSEKFWASYKDWRLCDDEKAVLLSTYDNAYIEMGRLLDFAAACRNVHGSIIETTEWNWNHFKSIADAAESLYKKHDHRCIGLAIGCTSVSDIWSQESPEKINYWGVYEQIKELSENKT